MIIIIIASIIIIATVQGRVLLLSSWWRWACCCCCRRRRRRQCRGGGGASAAHNTQHDCSLLSLIDWLKYVYICMKTSPVSSLPGLCVRRIIVYTCECEWSLVDNNKQQHISIRSRSVCVFLVTWEDFCRRLVLSAYREMATQGAG